MAYSQDLRARVMDYIESGHTHEQAADLFQIHHKTVFNWLKLKKATGSLTPRPHRGGVKARVTVEELEAYVEAHPDDTLEVMSKYFGFTIPGIHYHLKKHGYVHKKKL